MNRAAYPYPLRSAASAFTLLLSCLLASMPEAARAQPPTDEELLDQGIEAYNSGDYENGLRYLFAYRMRVPEPELLEDHSDFASDVDEAIETALQRLRDRVDEIRRLEERLAELTGTRVMGREMRPPRLEKPDPGRGDGAVRRDDAAREAGAPEIPEVRIAVREDCISFDPRAIRLTEEPGGWLLSEGTSRMLLFEDRTEAVAAVRTIRRYGMDRHCFVGRPDASMEYFLANGVSPEGRLSGEDCLSFDADRLAIRGERDAWRLVDGSRILMSFPKGAEAQHALRVIRKHGFSHVCHIGRPDPSMTYFRK